MPANHITNRPLHIRDVRGIALCRESQFLGQPFGDWGKIFPDPAMTLAAIDRLVHHATILEMNVESYRRRAALDRKRGRGRPAVHATINETDPAKVD